MSQKKSSYERLGVSASKQGLHDTLESVGLGANHQLFAQVAGDLASDEDFYSFLHCDGAGTKSIVSYICYRETDDPQAFRGLAQDALGMNIDDIYCLGTPERLVLANTITRNARLIDDEALGVILGEYRELCEQLGSLGIPIEISGGETADCGDLVRTLVVDASLAGRIAKKQLISAGSIKAGNIIVGLSSTGQASFERETNSGIGSNGLTLARHALLSSKYAEKYPEIADPSVDASLAYRGAFEISEKSSR